MSECLIYQLKPGQSMVSVLFLQQHFILMSFDRLDKKLARSTLQYVSVERAFERNIVTLTTLMVRLLCTHYPMPLP
jgi:hypothetical protein